MSQSSMSPASSGASQADPSQGDDDSDGGNQPYQIVIAVDGHGNITVGTDAGDDDSGDGADMPTSGDGDASGASDDGGESGNMQPVKNIKEALTIALDIYRNAGQITDSDSDFNSGYAGQSSNQQSGPSTYAGPGSE